MWLLKISLILVDSLLKVGPGKTKKILEKSWNFLTKKVYEPWSDKTLTLGVKEVNDGKPQTYVSCVNEVVSDINIQNSSTHDHDYCTENFMNKITK